jgi:hypothetical protein
MSNTKTGFVYGVKFSNDSNISFINYSYAKSQSSIRESMKKRFPNLQVVKVCILKVFYANPNARDMRLVGMMEADNLILERKPSKNQGRCPTQAELLIKESRKRELIERFRVGRERARLEALEDAHEEYCLETIEEEMEDDLEEEFDTTS